MVIFLIPHNTGFCPPYTSIVHLHNSHKIIIIAHIRAMIFVGFLLIFFVSLPVYAPALRCNSHPKYLCQVLDLLKILVSGHYDTLVFY